MQVVVTLTAAVLHGNIKGAAVSCHGFDLHCKAANDMTILLHMVSTYAAHTLAQKDAGWYLL